MDAIATEAPAFVLGPDLTIALAAENHGRLLQALPFLAADPRLDLSGVTDFDSSGVQLLLALRASLVERGQSLRLLDPSPVVREALGVYGLEAIFSDTSGEAAH